ncbi:hypothetical protein Z043_116741 [Scleropages formosus]|uniref:CUT domain-containing protein n=1 Tax=Scleropages formosus TaxID=113540 RepID=A0A0P7UXM8_SCLFO|nr:hypothetical protein Z043_116741 [Scleropages formosus]
MDAMGEMPVHGHSELSHSQEGRAMLHSRELSAAFPRPPLGGSSMGLEPPGLEHSLSSLGYGGEPPSSCGSTYTTLTPLQPLEEKFHHPHHPHHPHPHSCLPVSNVIGSFTLMREDRTLGGNFYNTYGEGSGSCAGEEINTKEVAQRIITELKRYSIPQAIFAERVLCRSQGTLSDLLRNPKPWGKLKSGRETFKRMSRWLQEPEFQRMATLRLEGPRRRHEPHGSAAILPANTFSIPSPACPSPGSPPGSAHPV